MLAMNHTLTLDILILNLEGVDVDVVAAGNLTSVGKFNLLSFDRFN
jgi:hypothetical protein